MEGDDVAKAPVTRLRRRLSLDKDASSPVAPSTPTKKRLAVKPQLENIDELATISSPRGKRRTSSVRGSVETPEEKALTPARRSTRIKSNTSLTSEVLQVDSPRAKRAARRRSTVDSDTEASLTPARKTRSTRKDSASSIETQDAVAKPTTQVANETITEEPEARKTSADNSLSSDSISPNSLRKSQRIAAKSTSRNSLNKSDSESNISLNKSKVRKSDTPVSTTKPSKMVYDTEGLKNNTQNATTSPKPSNIVNDSRKIKNGDDIDKKLNSSGSKDDSTNESRRQTTKPRAKSLTNMSDERSEAKISEDIKKGTNANRSFQCKKLTNDIGAGDAFIFNTKMDGADESLTISDKENIDVVLNTSRRRKRESERSMTCIKSDTSNRNSTDLTDGKDSVDTSAVNTNLLESRNFLQGLGGDDFKCTVYIADSDLITGSIGKTHDVQSNNADDQCVPVVEKVDECNKAPEDKLDMKDISENGKEKSSLFASKTLNCSIEPMDIDETIPGNSSIPNSPPTITVTNMDSSQLSRSRMHEKTTIENKSTLILSQLKDESASDANVTKSPKKNNASISKANTMSVTDSSSKTPLKNKHHQQSVMQTSTPVIPTNLEQEADHSSSKTITPKDHSKISQRRNEKSRSNESGGDSSDEESSLDESDILDDEAEDAGDNYESGDSQDDSQRRYEEENEIVEQGCTLTSSDEDISNDDDYEKDSFIVSCDEEDNDLLSGSGDDLSLGDNELNMSSKSKQKYNERKVKEQKKASREMYEARHGKKKSLPESSDDELTSNPIKKNRRQRIDSSPLQSGDEFVVIAKKNSRSRLVSTDDQSAAKSDNNESLASEISKKKSVLHDITTNEKEITLAGNESILQEEDPLKTSVKAEPKTPQKGFNISTVNVNTVMDVEQVQINENASILEANETSDPLQVTMTSDNEDSDSSSVNEEIFQNYESVLSSLTKETEQNQKNLNMSLNLHKKSKQTSNPIIYQLNLTETKSAKAVKPTETKNTSKKNKSNENLPDEESTTDSVDLKLLFSGDDASESSDSKKSSAKQSCYPGDEDFIPLKRTEGKTNLRENIGKSPYPNISKTPENSKKKNKISESSEAQWEVKGDSRSELNMSTSSKKKKKTNSESSAAEAALTFDIKSAIFEDRTPASNKKNKTRLNSVSIGEERPMESAFSVHNSNKKKKKLSESSVVPYSNEPETPSLLTPGSGKKSKKFSLSLNNEQIDGTNEIEGALPSNKKSRKSSDPSEASIVTDFSLTVTPGSKTKNKKHSESAEKIDVFTSVKGAPSSNKNKSIKYSEPTEASPESSIGEKLLASEEKYAGDKATQKRKRNSSFKEETAIESLLDNPHDLLLAAGRQKKKKRKIAENYSDVNKEVKETEIIFKSESSKVQASGKSKKKKSLKQHFEEPVLDSQQNKKRKQRSDDEKPKHTKLIEEAFLQNITVPRLPTNILDQLDEKHTCRKANIVSTSAFEVVETKLWKNKPSQYLEESIYINSVSPEKKKRKKNVEKPKVLPFVPTASTSTSGFTTNFKVKVNPRETAFIAQANDLPNFKKDFLLNKKMKRLGTFEMYKKQRSIKLCKF